jgi:hypothetical protein
VFDNALRIEVCLNDGSRCPSLIQTLWSPAFAWGFYNKVVLNGELQAEANRLRFRTYAWNLTSLLTHEMTHSIISSTLAGGTPIRRPATPLGNGRGTPAVALTANTQLAPKHYERQLLAHYQASVLPIGEVIDLLDNSSYCVLYRSRATRVPSEADLQALLEWSRAYNAQHHSTGLLLYSDGLFGQLLEGPEVVGRSLYARIQADTAPHASLDRERWSRPATLVYRLAYGLWQRRGVGIAPSTGGLGNVSAAPNAY